ncbi:hypothetical protein EUX98_g366 [Antrodiella citrinella]|uniref:Uncharacterized protein n=1 Tax=Antrodiella citrinella TaxID=2447956 RepID=A0A4S4N727_9APHY|nr:hypothetical protein EUX98_g366 [Antrodiella citrinella]
MGPSSPLMRHASPAVPVQAQAGQIQPGSLTYTTSVGPDGSVTYHPFRAVPARLLKVLCTVYNGYLRKLPLFYPRVPLRQDIIASFNRPGSGGSGNRYDRDWRDDGRRGSVADDPYRRHDDDYARRGDYRRDDRDRDYRDRDRDPRDKDPYRRGDDRDPDRDRDYRGGARDDYGRRDRDRYDRERDEELRNKGRDRDYDRKYGSSTADLERRFQDLDVDRDRRDPYDSRDSRDYRDTAPGTRSRRNSTYGADRPPTSAPGGYPTAPYTGSAQTTTYTGSNYAATRGDAAGVRRPVSPYREGPVAPRPVSPYQAGGVIPRAASPYQAGGTLPRAASPYQTGGALPRPVSPYSAGARPVSAYGGAAPVRPTSAYGGAAPVVPRGGASPYRAGGALPARPTSPYYAGATAGAASHSPYAGGRPVSPNPNPYGPRSGISRAASPGPSPYAGGGRPVSPNPNPYGPRSGISRAASPGGAYTGINGTGGSPVTYTARGGYEAAPEEDRMLAAPEGFSRPPNLAQSYTPFDILKIQDMDDFFENIPRMPLVLVTHDVYHEDWIRLMTDLSLSWSNKLPVPQYANDGHQPRRTTLTADLIDLWNASFFIKRGAELVLYKGRERRSGRNIGQVDVHLPGFDDYGDYSDEDDDLSDDDDYDDRSRHGAYGGVYSRGVDREMAEMHEARRLRHERKKLDQKRRRVERRHRQKTRDADRMYALYLTCVSPRDL